MRRPTKPIDEEDHHEEDGPRRPKIKRPDVGRVIERMKKNAPDKARKYANPKNSGQ